MINHLPSEVQVQLTLSEVTLQWGPTKGKHNYPKEDPSGQSKEGHYLIWSRQLLLKMQSYESWDQSQRGRCKKEDGTETWFFLDNWCYLGCEQGKRFSKS